MAQNSQNSKHNPSPGLSLAQLQDEILRLKAQLAEAKEAEGLRVIVKPSKGDPNTLVVVVEGAGRPVYKTPDSWARILDSADKIRAACDQARESRS